MVAKCETQLPTRDEKIKVVMKRKNALFKVRPKKSFYKLHKIITKIAINYIITIVNSKS